MGDRKRQNLVLTVAGKAYQVAVQEKIPGKRDVLEVSVDGQQYIVGIKTSSTGEQIVEEIRPISSKPDIGAAPVPVIPAKEKEKWKADHSGIVPAPIPGRVIHVKTKVGDRVKVGDVLVILEAMKMHNDVTAPKSGEIRSIVKEGTVVNFGDDLAIIE
ncbi:MAG: biotin/lipoyl-containing protein [Candidatus Hodarchaeota archaeon]